MNKKLTVSPLQHEFWPLEGVWFEPDADDEDDALTVVCSVYGDIQFKGFVELKFLKMPGVDITSARLPDALCTFILKGTYVTVNDCFRGFGIMFQKDFETDKSLTVSVVGKQDYSFLINLE